MTPEEINMRIATWAGLDSHVCDEWSFHCDDCERGSIQTPDYFGSNAAMDLLGVLVERGQRNGKGWTPQLRYTALAGEEWCLEIFVADAKDINGYGNTIPAAICTAILELIERDGE